ncbi:hypothetical protein JTB14_010081 [Gonioctena quinquepunctata]|nr:hypothetical protein JTB14_010081 [Gonioctena quinquepunctata]
MGNQTMQMRREAIESGRNYEKKMTALLSTKLALDPTIEDFEIVSNVEGFGDFDDVVIRTEDRNGLKQVYCIQLKHKENRPLQIKQMESGDPSLIKYQESYKKIKENLNKIGIMRETDIKCIQLVIYTNAGFKGGKGNSISASSIHCTNFLNTSKNTRSTYKISNLPTSVNPLDQDFLSQLTLYTEQASEQRLDSFMREELCGRFENISNNVITSLIDFFSKWSSGRKAKITILRKRDVQFKLLEFIISPYVVDPGIGIAKDGVTMEILRETLVSFNVTRISQFGFLENIFPMMRDKISSVCGISIDDTLPWNTNVTQDQLNEIFKPDSDKDKLLIRSLLQERNHFLPHPVPQGSLPFSLECWVYPIDTGLWIRRPAIAGENIDVESYYVKRNLSIPTFKLNLLDKQNVFSRRDANHAGDLFMVIEERESLILWKYSAHKMSLERYIKNIQDGETKDDIYILTVNKNLLKAAMEIIVTLHETTKKNIHIMETKGEKQLKWLHSEGSIEILQACLADVGEESIVTEDGLVESESPKVSIISSNAGMGKTNLLKSISRKLGPNEWVNYVNLNHHYQEMITCESAKNAVNYLCIQQFKNYEEVHLREFIVYLFFYFLQHGQMTWLFDGYDEVASEEMLSILKRIKDDPSVKLWITTRPTVKYDLERSLGSLSYELTCFDEKDHIDFLVKYLENHHIFKYDKKQIDSLVESIRKCSGFLDKSFVGIPLQTKMLAEIFGDDPDLKQQKENLTVVQLYNIFIDIKLREYTSYEATSLRRTLSKLALKVFYTEKSLENLIDFDDLNEDIVAFKDSYKKDSIVTGINDKGEVLFGHRTFAEFLAAQWLSKKIVDKKSSGQYDPKWAPLVKMLFYHELQPVRVFFDRILSEGLIMHSAILANNLEKTLDILKSQDGIAELDILGRSALHIAVSHGTFYDLYRASAIEGVNNIRSHSHVKHTDIGIYTRVPRMNNQQVSLDTIEKLIEHGFSNTKDKLFGYDLFDFAMKSCSLEVVNSLFKHFNKENLLFEKEFMFEVFVYCIVYKNLYNILCTRKYFNFEDLSQCDIKEIRNIFLEKIDLLKVKYDESYLSEIAASQGSQEILFVLLSSGILKINQGFPMHKASVNGHCKIVRFLHAMGVDLNHEDVEGTNPMFISGTKRRSDITYQYLTNPKFLGGVSKKKSSLTPLHYACQGGHLCCVETLLELGANPNKVDGFGFTPLTYAATYGYTEIIQKLLENGKMPEEVLQQACFIVCYNNNNKCFQLFLDHVDVNGIVNEEDYTLLMLACKKGCLEIVKQLASIGITNLNSLNTQETFKRVLHWAQANNHAPSVKLIPLGPNPLDSGKGGMSALHYAVRHGHADCVEALLDSGADEHIEDGIECCGYTPLVWASMYGQSRITQILLSKTYGKKQVREVELALVWASILGYDECLKHLLSLYDHHSSIFQGDSEHLKRIISAEFGFNARDIDLNGNIPMILAGKNCQLSVIQELVSKGFKGNKNLDDALHWAVQKGDVKCVRGLLELGANENTIDSITGMGYLPIVWACLNRKAEVARILLEGKSRDYLSNEDLHLALVWACVGGDYSCVEILLEFGLNVDTIDPKLGGNTPLISICQYTGTPEVVDALISHSCNLTIKNEDGKSALDIVLEKRNYPIARRILMATKQQEFKAEKTSLKFANLQEVLKEAVNGNDHELIAKLAELGVEGTV